MAITKEKIKKWAEKGKLEKLLKALKADDTHTRKLAVYGLGQIGDTRVVEPLVRALGDIFVQKNAISVLVKIGPPTVVSLIKALSHNNAIIRWGAAKTLGKIGDSRALKSIYESNKISLENKKTLLKLKNSKLKISLSHTDQRLCKDHTDSIQDIYFDL